MIGRCSFVFGIRTFRGVWCVGIQQKPDVEGCTTCYSRGSSTELLLAPLVQYPNVIHCARTLIGPRVLAKEHHLQMRNSVLHKIMLNINFLLFF